MWLQTYPNIAFGNKASWLKRLLPPTSPPRANWYLIRGVQVTDVSGIFREDMVSFFLGCSFGFERALQEHGIEVRNITEGKNVSMYKTNREVYALLLICPLSPSLFICLSPVVHTCWSLSLSDGSKHETST